MRYYGTNQQAMSGNSYGTHSFSYVLLQSTGEQQTVVQYTAEIHTKVNEDGLQVNLRHQSD